ncbi:MAG: hypothetical protein Q8M24_02500 [Pseudolabrys sp.]|nr:hypothetical protein [Pseudolabrys sp.]
MVLPHSPLRLRSRAGRALAGLAGAAAIVMLATAGAQAFTIDNAAPGNTGDATKFTDPADRAKSRMTGDSSDRSTYRNGNTTLQFGGRESFDQRNNTDRYFSPNTLMGR